MLSFRLLTPFTLLLSTISAVSAELKVSLTGPEYIDHVRDLKVFATITNDGKDMLNILRDPRGLLSDLPADKFLITNERNDQPKFIGIRAKYVPAIAAEFGEYTVLKPGHSVTIEHDLSAAYDFSTSGGGDYTIRASGCFYMVDAMGDILPISADTGHHITKIAVKLARLTAEKTVVEKRAKFIGCSSSQESQITSAIPITMRYIQNAFNDLQEHTGSTARYITWFGNYTDQRHDIVLSHFQHIHGCDFSSFTYDCTCSDADVFAFVYPDRFGTIHLCGAFWHAPTSGTDSKAGTLIHEASHFALNGGALDEAYGQEAAEELAHDSPAEAVLNADSHEYFAENDPALN